MELSEYQEYERDVMRRQAEMRAIAFDENADPSARAEAQQGLFDLVEEYKEKCPPITGVFPYTEEDVEEAKRHGF